MLKKIMKYVVTLIILTWFFIVSLTVVSSFPSSWIRENTKKSSETLMKEGNKKKYFSLSHFETLEFDNYSDALMINTAYSIDAKAPLYSILVARKNYIPGVTKKIVEDFVGDLASNSNKYDKLDQVNELYDTVRGEAPESYEYARYWHGYMLFLRPLLILLDYWKIRVLLLAIFAVLAIRFLVLVEKEFGKLICIIFGIVLCEIDYFYIGLSLLNTPTTMIMIIFGIFLLKNFEKIRDFSYVFFLMGCFANFFCLLDYPLITYEMGIIIYLLYQSKKRNYEIQTKQDLIDILKLGFFWILGYSVIWGMKWVFIDIIYHKHMVSLGLQQILYRSSNTIAWGKEIIHANPVLAICINILFMGVPILINIALGVMLLYIKPNRNLLHRMRNTIPFLVVALIPIVWLGLFTNHSFQHSFFACRILFSTLMFLLLLPGILTEKILKREDNSEKKTI